MATTFAAVVSTTAPSSPTVYYTLVRGTAASPTTGTRTAMTARRTVGGTSIWEADITWDNSWVSPRIDFDDGSTPWVTGTVTANTTQISGTATALGALSGSQSVTVTGIGISVTDA